VNDKCLSGELPAARSFWGGGVLDSFDVHANLYHVTYTDDDKEEIDTARPASGSSRTSRRLTLAMPDACCFVDDEGSKIELRAVETDINGGADEPLSGRSLQLWSGGNCEVGEVDELEWRLGQQDLPI
jgi:hypothetical protein